MSVRVAYTKLGFELTRFNEYCKRHDGKVTFQQYWDNVNAELAKFHAYVNEDRVITFESEVYFTWFAIKWS